MCFYPRDKADCRHNKDASREIDRLLLRHEKRLAREAKILLLGPGESGKTTVLKQMKIIHCNGYSREERLEFRSAVFSNMLTALQLTLNFMRDSGAYIEEKNKFYRDLVLLCPSSEEPFGDGYKDAFSCLWNDKILQDCVAQGRIFGLPDNVTYFFVDVERLFALSYIPTDQDILQTRVRTTNIQEQIFHTLNFTYRMLDVGGQRNERRKWIHCFENIQAILFLVAISGYDLCVTEDMNANQMEEALMLFDSICNSQWFVNTSIILFLNKLDIFEKKVQHAPIQLTFPDFSPPKNDKCLVEAGCDFFKEKFVGMNQNLNKDIYVHFTNATDTNLLNLAMISIQDMILQRNLQSLIL